MESFPKVVIKAMAVDVVCYGSDLNVTSMHKLDEDIRKSVLVVILSTPR